LTYRLFSFLMALFWIFVQQVCFCGVRWACEDLGRTGRSIRPLARIQAGILLLLAALAAADLWLLPPIFPHDNNSPSLVWQFLCTVMMALDGGIVAGVWRIHRIHATRENPGEDRSLRFARIWAVGCLLVYGLYFAGALPAVGRYGLNGREWEALCLFYFRIVNLFYLVLEGSAGLIALALWRNLRKEAAGRALS
jgi:hypothetical protein